MLKHAFFSALEGLLSMFDDLQIVDYGTNSPESLYLVSQSWTKQTVTRVVIQGNSWRGPIFSRSNP